MTAEESKFRASLSPDFNQSKIEYIKKLSNGNTFVTYSGIPFEVTPKGTLKPVKNQ